MLQGRAPPAWLRCALLAGTASTAIPKRGKSHFPMLASGRIASRARMRMLFRRDEHAGAGARAAGADA